MNADGPRDDLTRQVRLATRAVAAAQVISQVVALLVLAALYRLVEPAEFGLMGMAVPLVLLLRCLASAGLSVATVQQERLSAAQISACFWLQLGFGAVVTVITAACAPALALAYRTPQVTAVCLALAGTSLVAACGAQHQALLERKLKLGRLAVVRLVAQLMGGLAGIGAAVGGWGVWALLLQQYVELCGLTLGSWIAEPFRPGRPDRGISIRSLLHFSGWYGLSSLLFALAFNLDKILLAFFLGGTRSGQAALGMYTQAYNLMVKPVYLVTTPLTGVMLPTLSRARAEPETHRNLLARFYRLTGIALLPCGFGLFVVAEDVILTLGGAPWLAAGDMLRALAPAILVLGSINISGSVFSAAGRADRLALGALAVSLLLAGGLAVGLFAATAWAESPVDSALGVAWAFSLTILFAVSPIYLVYCVRTVGARWRTLAGSQLPALLAAAGMGLGVWLLREFVLIPAGFNPLVRLVLLMAAGIALYGVLAAKELAWLRRQA
jgi:PST family polysaccharide transporter